MAVPPGHRSPAPTPLNFYYVNDLVWSPTGLIYAATSTGVWSWVDGVTAPAQILVPALAGGCLDLALRPILTTSDWLMASCGTGVQAKVYVARAAEITTTTAQWDMVLSELEMGRTSLSFSPVTFNLVYALSANKTTGALHAVFRSVDGGYTWTKGASVLSVNFQDRLLLEDPKLRLCDGVTVAQGAYANVIAADPVSPNVVYVGGHDLFRSSDGGVTFLPISSGFQVGQPHYLPPSQHAIVFHPSSGNMIVGNDGGLFTKTSGGSGGAFRRLSAGGVDLQRCLRLAQQRAQRHPVQLGARSSRTTRPTWAARRATARSRARTRAAPTPGPGSTPAERAAGSRSIPRIPA